MTTKNLLVVLGATGAQGTSVVEYFLGHLSDQYAVRALTRDPTKTEAVRLASLGAEVVAADFDDETSLVQAFSGADFIFGITNFWDKASIDIEVQQGLLVAKVASELPHLKHFVFSSLPDATKFAQGKFQNVLPYNAKTKIRDGMIKLYPQLWEKTTTIYVGFYFQNWLKYPIVFGPQKKSQDSFVLIQPYSASSSLPLLSSTDTGVIVAELLRGGPKFFGKTVSLLEKYAKVEDTLKSWADILNIKAEFKEVTPAEFQAYLESKGLSSELAAAAVELCQVVVLQERYMQADGVLQGRELLGSQVSIKSWEQYVAEEDWASLLQ